MLIESLVLLPSYAKRKQDLLATQSTLVLSHLKNANIRIRTEQQSPDSAHAAIEQVLVQLRSQGIIHNYAVVGKDRTQSIPSSDSFEVDLPNLQNLLDTVDRIPAKNAYETSIHLENTSPPLYLLISYDTQSIQSDLNAYVGRMLSIVLLISIVVTMATVLGVERVVIRPVLYLKEDLETAERNFVQNNRNSPFYATNLKYQNELSEVISTFQLMYTRIWDSIDEHQATRKLEQQERHRANQLDDTIIKLHQTQTQLVQTEKMASLSQVVAGVAHEINNPLSFIQGNISHVQDYTYDLLELLELYQQYDHSSVAAIQDKHQQIDIDFIRADLPKALNSIHTGSERISEIVLSLRTFSHLGEATVKSVDIHQGLESVLAVLRHHFIQKTDSKRYKTTIEVQKNYTSLPLVECNARLLNQVFFDIISNAIEALLSTETSPSSSLAMTLPTKTITLGTAFIEKDQQVEITISNNGPGLDAEIQTKIFEPFFTTKMIGKGIGMGLATSYQIITNLHHGTLRCLSATEADVTFAIRLPIQQTRSQTIWPQSTETAAGKCHRPEKPQSKNQPEPASML